jgi:hypothetical protein
MEQVKHLPCFFLCLSSKRTALSLRWLAAACEQHHDAFFACKQPRDAAVPVSLSQATAFKLPCLNPFTGQAARNIDFPR